MLLGADVYSSLLYDQVNTMRSPDRQLIAQQTVLGWLVSGPANRKGNESMSFVVSNFVEVGTPDMLRKFWELEEVNVGKAWSLEEKGCEDFFEKTVKREASGRYTVSLPFKSGIVLGNSRKRAEQRLISLEKQLSKQSERKDQYVKVIEEYFELGHVEPATEAENCKSDSEVFYMPHHAVIKESSSTTKLCVVFDASAKSSSGLSLNDCLMVGPKVQEDILDILIRFRLHPVAFSGDVAKMYRQLMLAEDDRDYHRFLWRKEPEHPIREYRMRTVTFGVASSAHHAQKVLLRIADDEAERYPLAAPVVRKDFCMDDCLTGARDVESGLELQKQIIGMLKCGGFEMRKWVSHESALLEDVPE